MNFAILNNNTVKTFSNNVIGFPSSTNDKFILKGDTNLIDGSVSNVKYIPLCGKCYLDEKRKYEEE